jgi:hypothetical protein
MKSTRNTLRIPALTSIFPEAFVVHIVRHPCAVTQSLLKVNWWPDLELWWRDGTPRELEAQGWDRYDLCAEHWSRQVDAGLDGATYVAPGRYIEVRYEDLLAEPKSTLEKTVSSLGLTYNSKFAQRVEAHGIDGSRAWDWQNELSPETQERIQNTAGSRLERLGYA